MARYCKSCGEEINSTWKTLCYVCFHKKKGDYNPNKLQERYGGTKKSNKKWKP